MKTFTAIAALAAASSVNAFDAEFLRGAQTGFFLTSEEQFEDYSCPASVIAPQYQSMIDMALPMKMMMQNMNQGKPNPTLDTAFEVAMVGFRVASLFAPDYDGGEFCKGLVTAKEGSTIIFKAANMLMSSPPQADIPSAKKLALESKLQ